VRARVVIGEGEGEHDGQPEDGANDDKLCAFGTIARVHEIENNEVALIVAIARAMTILNLPKFWKAPRR